MAVLSVSFSLPNGALLATGSWDKSVKLWDVADGSLSALEGHSDPASSVAFSPPLGALLATGSSFKSVKVWNVADGRLVRVLEGHSGAVSSVAFSPPNGALLATGSTDESVKLWQMEEPIPPFFATLRTALVEDWWSYKTLENLEPTVGDVTELKLFYSATSAAFKQDDITAAQRRKFENGVLESAARRFVSIERRWSWPA